MTTVRISVAKCHQQHSVQQRYLSNRKTPNMITPVDRLTRILIINLQVASANSVAFIQT
jgi:hypothetical protein